MDLVWSLGAVRVQVLDGLMVLGRAVVNGSHSLVWLEWAWVVVLAVVVARVLTQALEVAEQVQELVLVELWVQAVVVDQDRAS